MNPALESLQIRKYLIKCYEQVFAAVREEYGFTQLEIDILAYLKNNPERDTASDIVKYRLIPKANVSQAVELLIQKGYLTRHPDGEDRRRVHLLLREEARPAVQKILAAQRCFGQRLIEGISPEALEQFRAVSQKMVENAKREWE